jgi:hypothetical protein
MNMSLLYASCELRGMAFFMLSHSYLSLRCVLQALLNKLQDGSVGTGNNGVIAGVLATVGELARVVCDHSFAGFL